MRIQKARELTAEVRIDNVCFLRMILTRQIFQHRTRLDDQTLEQQNLLYELSHINKEISRCEEFK
jgi:hypothetical protein